MRSENSSPAKYEFDVAFSFAGEQRSYVEATACALKNRNVRVFYDRDSNASLWGKDLYQYLSDLYQNKARYCVVFLSKQYAEKLWTKHELKIMQAHAFQESREYILPARFDETHIPGLLPTIGYVDLRQLSLNEFAALISEKVSAGEPTEQSQPDRVDRELEWRLADAVLLAQDYLQPQSLSTSESIVRVIRTSFKLSDLQATLEDIRPYIRHDNASYRVVGYLAFQMAPTAEAIPDLITSLFRERRIASQQKETRPLWQLLVCFTKLLKFPLDKRSKEAIQDSLRVFQDFMQSDAAIDPGGQCKKRIDLLIERSA